MRQLKNAPFKTIVLDLKNLWKNYSSLLQQHYKKIFYGHRSS